MPNPNKGPGNAAGLNATRVYTSGDKQIISITDLISEGPIYGLVDAQASVFLNDDRAAPLDQAATYASQTAATVRLTQNSTTATVSASSPPILAAENGDKYLLVRSVQTIYVTASNGSSSDANGNTVVTLTTTNNTAFFNDSMISSNSGSFDTQVPARLGSFTQAHGAGDGGFGEGKLINRSGSTIAQFMPGSGAAAGLWVPDGNYFLALDRVVKIASVSGSTITLETAWPYPTVGGFSDYSFDVSGVIVTNASTIDQTEIKKYKSVTTQFRVGTLDQAPFVGSGGVGSTSITNSPSAGGTLEQSQGYGSGTQLPKVLIASSSSGFNLTASQIQEVDSSTLTFSYAGGLFAVSGKGNDKTTYVQYKVELGIKRPGQGDFDSYITLNNPLQHSGLYKNAVSFIKTIDLTTYRPFADFRVRVSRISNHTGDGYKTPTETVGDWQNQSGATLGTVTSVIKDVLTHPFTALARTTFDTKQFQSVPTRSYHAKGLKVLVPSNYVTRDQAASGVANYQRNTSTGTIESTYQDWDGSFLRDKVYTNNPAWIFYDILTNNRYGLGDYLLASDIDKYSLYRIARYCDELVSDGKGGEEPRFTANLYFTKQADAYKILKDIATVFRSMIYYFDGQIVPVMDAPSGPVYNFTSANVLDGQFSYESTGSKTRINQVIVTWVNPDSSYKAEPLIVEDRLNIAETGKIISQSAVAMGATSEGQALRYGRWKLWTAANQREVVTFSSALNSSFISPGDIVNIQDPNRHAVRLGGRVSNSGSTRTTSSIPLDSPTTLNSGSDYELSVLFTEPAAFATSDITIAGVTYSPGDIVKQAYITGSSNLQNIDTEEKAANARASSGATEALILSWTDTTRVETKTVDSTRGLLNTVSIKTSGTDANGNLHTVFSAVPEAEAIWVMTETNGGATVSSSSKQYKVLALSESAKGDIAFTAAEHYDEKFRAVDEDFTTFIADTVYPAVTDTDIVPPPIDVFSTSLMKEESVGEELVISWTPPSNVGDVPGEYEHLFGYEITHNFPDVENPIRISDSQQTSWKIDSVDDGNYSVAVRTVNIRNNLSQATRAEVTVTDRYKENIPRLPEGVPYTGTTSVGFGIVSDTFTFKRYNYEAKSPSADSTKIINTNQTATAWSQNCSGLPEITWSENDRAAGGEFIRSHAYILLDASDSTDRLKLLKYHRPAFSTPFWYDTGTGNNSNKYGSALTGTVSKPASTSKVTGSGTSFLTQVQAGDVLKLDNTAGYKVASVLSDTVMYVTNSFGAHSNVSAYPPNIRIDYSNDVIIARVYNTSGGLVLAETYATIDSQLKPAGDIIEADGIATEEIAENAVTVTEIDTTSETGGTFGAAVAALDAASFTSIDTDVLDANSVIAREVQVFPVGGTAPTISGTTLTGAGIDLKQDGDMYVGSFADNKYMFWDQSEGTMTFRGTLDVDDITGSSATFATLMAEVATIGTLNTKMLDSEAIVTRDIRVGPSDEITAGSFVVGTEYYITDLGNTTQVQWNSVAGTSGVVYNLGGIFTAANAGTGTGKARNRTTVAKIANTTLTGSGAHLNAAGDFYVGDASANKYMFWDQSAGTMTLRGELNADDITAGTISANKIDVTNLSALSANLGNVTAGTLKGGTLPEATSAPTGTESGAFLDLGVGKMVLGNASKYIWWDGTNLTINGVTISNASLANSSGFATETYVDDEITALIGGAPGALDTLNELAFAINDDASFASSVTTSLGNKVGTASSQALSASANALEISGSTITLTRGDGSTDTVTTPNTNTQRPIHDTPVDGATTTSISSNWAFDNVKSAVPANALFTDTNTFRAISSTPTDGATTTSISSDWAFDNVKTAVPENALFTDTQRSDEEIRDLAAGIITAGTNVSIVKNDAANTVTISSTNTNTFRPIHDTPVDGSTTTSISSNWAFDNVKTAVPENALFTDTNTQRTDEEIRDVAAAIITAGTNISVVKNDAANTVTIASSFTNTQRTDEEIRDVAAAMITAGTNVTVSTNDAADTVTISSTDTNTTYTAGTGITLTGTEFSNSAPDQTVALTGAGLTTISGSYPNFTISSSADGGDADELGGIAASNYVTNVHGQALHASDALSVSGTTVTLRRADGNTETITTQDTNTQRPIHDTPVDGATTTSISSNWAFDNVKTAVPANALFTDTNTFRAISSTPTDGATTTSISSDWAFDNVKTAVPANALFTDTNTVYTHPNHTGDVTSSGDGTTTIGSNKVTFAKMQDIDTDTFMGRTAAGTGDAKALSVSEARTMLNVEDGATADQTAAQILAALKTVDVNGTAGINAGTFDGLPGANIPKFYNNAVLTDSASTASFIAELASDYGCFGNNQVTLKVQWSYAGSSDLVTGHATIGTLELAGCTIETWGGTYKHVRITRPNTGTGGHMVVEYNDQSSGYSPGWREIWTSESDGAGSGLDADKLDGQQGTHYLAYANFTGTPTIPSGNQIIDWTTDQGVTNIHSGNYTDTNTTEFNIQAETGSVQAITAGNTVTFTASGAASVSRTGNTIDISSTNTNTTYTAGTGLSLTGTEFTNSAPDQTVALTGSGATTVTGTYPNFTISSTDTNTDTNTWNANAAGVAGYVAVPVANKVWKTDGSGNPAWRNDAEGSSATGTVTSVTATANTGLTVTNTTTTPVITLDSTLTTLGSATFTTLNVDILDADKILTRDIRVGPTGQTGGVDNAAKINGTTLTGSGAALNETGDFFVGNSASAHMFFDQSAGTLAMKSGTSGARTEIVGGTTKVYDSSNNVRVIIGDLS